ncbi:hypothetical protein HanXRQr2_Chr17g0779771 [Helianthus annuus]|uniref:Uncharacterized protein n=1 Tax=Helianthus annuus TaxID=4232 RepID=A0A9K3GSR0_HELAN|nr:hypothetical protein HanXRQr2_Chr17g0779771 [Helianthus annuus]
MIMTNMYHKLAIKYYVSLHIMYICCKKVQVCIWCLYDIGALNSILSLFE